MSRNCARCGRATIFDEQRGSLCASCFSFVALASDEADIRIALTVEGCEKARNRDVLFVRIETTNKIELRFDDDLHERGLSQTAAMILEENLRALAARLRAQYGRHEALYSALQSHHNMLKWGQLADEHSIRETDALSFRFNVRFD
jgi:hypothetical protein